MGEDMIKYPIGEQDFKSLREAGSVYVDKTNYISKIVRSGSKYLFLARPRRFGKSLFLSTLRYFFEGKRELFKNLYIDSDWTIDGKLWDWAEYPVLRLDLNTDRYSETGMLEPVLDNLFREWEKLYGIRDNSCGNQGNSADRLPLSQRFKNIVEAAHEKTGRQVVILVDEYDKPLVGNLNKNEAFEHYRNALASIYSNFKSSAEHIRLVFLTGVSRFSKLSVFSDLNNLRDITFLDEYADICGITEEELLRDFQPGIERLAIKNRMDYDSACKLLKSNYDGYRFAATGSDIYNPWSLLNALEDSKIGNYWTNTGTPTIVAEALKKTNGKLEKILNIRCNSSRLSGLDLDTIDPVALMYQTGYLTIKDYKPDIDTYMLGIPNREVKENLFSVIIPYYVKIRQSPTNAVVQEIINNLNFGEPDELMLNLQTYLSGIPYDMHMENENNFQNALYILLSLIGVKAKVEEHTSEGRIDIEIGTNDYRYIIELKYDHSAEEALKQIEERHYARKHQTSGKKVFLIGVSFSSHTRCIESWIIKPL